MQTVFTWILFAPCCIINGVRIDSLFVFHKISKKKFNLRFGVIVAYVTNITLQHAVENATSSARYAVEDTRCYLK